MADMFDLVVIGAGPGGYVAAIRAAQLGMKVACVEARKALGGTCLNIGCIPSKALLTSSEKFHEAQHGLAAHGVKVSGVSLDLPAMMAHKDKVVADNTAGIDYLFKKNKVSRFHGSGRIVGAGMVSVVAEDGKEQRLATKHILIATGSDSVDIPNVAVDEQQIVSSTGALTLAKVPKSLMVIGGGYIGLEMGSVWARLGAAVTVVEYLPRILPGMDGDISKEMQKILTQQGFVFRLGSKVMGALKQDKNVQVNIEAAEGGKAESLQAEIVLVSVGRKPRTAGLGLAEMGVALDERGRVKVDAHFATNVAGIYAVGDVIAGPMLAHKAEEEGVACVEMLAGQKGHVNYDAIPGVVYTWPEAATVGKTEEELKAAGAAYKVGKFPFSANGRARAMGEAGGFVKLLADAKTDRLLGAHILGAEAGTMIAELALAMEFGASSEDVARTCHAHPTLNEAIKEAALAVDSRAVHI